MPAPGTPDSSAGTVQLDLLRRRVMNVVGHELRTPITTIGGLCRLLEADGSPAVREQVVPALSRQVARVESLVDDLLLAASITTVLPVEARRPVPAAAAVRAAWEELGGGPLPLDGDEGAAALVVPRSLHRILAALLDNARKYGEGPVAVSVRATAGAVSIRVSSEGSPVTAADVDLAFEPFYRGEGAVLRAPGLGVGLTVARALAEHSGGTVELRSRPGGGADATVTLGAA